MKKIIPFNRMGFWGAAVCLSLGSWNSAAFDADDQLVLRGDADVSSILTSVRLVDPNLWDAQYYYTLSFEMKATGAIDFLGTATAASSTSEDLSSHQYLAGMDDSLGFQRDIDLIPYNLPYVNQGEWQMFTHSVSIQEYRNMLIDPRITDPVQVRAMISLRGDESAQVQVRNFELNSIRENVRPTDRPVSDIEAQVGDGQVNLSWVDSGGKYNRILIRDGNDELIRVIDKVMQNQYTVTGLDNGLLYSFEVQDFSNRLFDVERSSMVTAVPEQPFLELDKPSVRLETLDDGRVAVRWDAVEGANAYHLRGLKTVDHEPCPVYIDDDGQAVLSPCAPPPPPMPINIRLTDGEMEQIFSPNYNIHFNLEVAATNTALASPWSGLNYSDNVTIARTYIVADFAAPESVWVDIVSDERAVLRWTPVTGANRYHIIGAQLPFSDCELANDPECPVIAPPLPLDIFIGNTTAHVFDLDENLTLMPRVAATHSGKENPYENLNYTDAVEIPRLVRAVDCDHFGVVDQGDYVTVYRQDEGWSGQWNYLCINGTCYSGELSDGYYQRDFSITIDAINTIEFKVQDNQTGQFIELNDQPEKQVACPL